MSQTFARITLLEAFKPAGKEIDVVLRYGSGEARMVSSAGEIGLPGLTGDDIVDAGAHQGIMPRSVTRMLPGKPNLWVLSWSDKAKRATLAPPEAARMWFGDERIPKTAPPNTPPDATYGYERTRIAARWGWWIMPRLALNGRTSCTRGEMDYDATKIGAPRIPHVEIQRVDASGEPIGEAFRPWEWFAWEADVDTSYQQPLAGPGAQAAPASLAGFSLDDLEAFVKAQRTKEKTQAAAGA